MLNDIDIRPTEATLNLSITEAKNDFYNLDNYASKLQFKIMDDTYLVFTNYEILKKYEYVLFENSVLTPLKERYKFRPEHLSIALYGTPQLWYLLLFLNKMTSPSQFKKENIRVIHPSKVNLIEEIYLNEKEYLKANSEADVANLQLKSLFGKSNKIGRLPSFEIGKPNSDYDDTSNDNNLEVGDLLNYEPILYNSSRSYLNSKDGNEIYYYIKTGGVYDSSGLNGNIDDCIDKYIIGKPYMNYTDSLVSFKPLIAGGFFSLKINDEEILTSEDNSEEIIVLNSLSPKKMNSTITNRYNISENVLWHSDATNALLVKIISEKNDNLGKFTESINVGMNFVGGETKYQIIRSSEKYDKEFIFPVNISDNYGKLLSISITVAGCPSKLRESIYKSAPLVSFKPTFFNEVNMLLEKNEIYNLKLNYIITKQDGGDFINPSPERSMLSLFRYGTSDYKPISTKDVFGRDKVSLTSYSFNPPVSSTIRNPMTIKSTSTRVFNGLQLISLIPNDELFYKSGQLYDETDNPLIDENGYFLYDVSRNSVNKQIKDFYITLALGCENNNKSINGAMGFYFKGKNTDGDVKCYIYILKMKNEYTDKAKINLSGLYKMDGSYEHLFIDTDEINAYRLKKIADTNQRITGNLNTLTNIRIVTHKNNIKIYDMKSNYPIIDFYDPEEIQFGNNDQPIQPSVGLVLYNIYNPIYSNMSILGKLSNIGDDY